MTNVVTVTGHIYDPVLNIYFTEARFYDATNRTWMAIDLTEVGLNWYQYAFSNPTTYCDLTGLFVVIDTNYDCFSILNGSEINPYADDEFGQPIPRGEYLQRDITDLHVADCAARIIFHEDTLPAGQDAITWTIFNRAMNPEVYADPDMPHALERVLMSDSGVFGGYKDDIVFTVHEYIQ